MFRGPRLRPLEYHELCRNTLARHGNSRALVPNCELPRSGNQLGAEEGRSDKRYLWGQHTLDRGSEMTETAMTRLLGRRETGYEGAYRCG